MLITGGTVVFLFRLIALATTRYELNADACVRHSLFGRCAIRYQDIQSVRWTYGTFSRAEVRGSSAWICIRLWTLHPRARGLIARQLAHRVPEERQRGWETLATHLRLPDDCCAVCGYPLATSSSGVCPECGAAPDPTRTA